MLSGFILYFLAMTESLSPLLMRSLMSLTRSTVSLALALLSPEADLPFAAMSFWFISRVLRKRCSGLKQIRLSHRWRTHRSLSKSIPRNRCADKRCVVTFFGNLCLITPYPWLPTCPVQFQHPVAVSITRFESNLSSGVTITSQKKRPRCRSPPTSLSCLETLSGVSVPSPSTPWFYCRVP